MEILFTDTESSDLAASFGRLFCASFVTLDGEPYTFRADKRPWKGKDKLDDGPLVKAIKREWQNADMVVTWNGKGHDVPLVTARLALVDEDPPRLKSHLDGMWYTTQFTMKIGSKKLENVARFFKSPHQKTPLDPQVWQRAAMGDKRALDYVDEHCQADVLVLRDLWPHIAPLVKQFNVPLASWWRFAKDIERV